MFFRNADKEDRKTADKDGKDKDKGEKKQRVESSGTPPGQRNSGAFRPGSGGDSRQVVNSPHQRPSDGAGDRWPNAANRYRKPIRVELRPMVYVYVSNTFFLKVNCQFMTFNVIKK